MEIILDTNYIIKYPRLLGVKLPDTTFLTTTEVIEELKRNARQGHSENRLAIINEADTEGNIQIVNAGLEEISKHQRKIPNALLSQTDISLLTTALFCKETNQHVKIGTFDRDIINISRRLGIDCLSEEDIKQLLVQSDKQPSEIKEKIIELNNKETRGFFWQIGYGIVTTSIGFFASMFLKEIAAALHIWGMLLLFLIIGIALFFWREKLKFSYGLFEFLAGFITILIALMPSNFDFKTIIVDPELELKILGGLYIMVRGQDNIVKGLKGTKYGIFVQEKLRLGL